MKRRCLDTSSKEYPNYGGRGISICDRWSNSFVNFLIDMGERPSIEHTLERIDNDSDYTPENCKWATRQEQQINRRLPANNVTGYRGISFESGAWRARISNFRRNIHLGTFDSKEEAALAYDCAAIQLYGDNAQLNILGGAV